MSDLLIAVILSAALSVDTFVFALGYGVGRVKITFLQAALVSLICSAVIVLFGIVGSLVSCVVPPLLCKAAACIALAATGFAKLLHGEETGEIKKLTVSMIVTLSAVMSLDGLAVGFGNGLCGFRAELFLPASFAVTLLAVLIGNRAGGRIGEKCGRRAVCAGGVILVILGVSKLFV